MRHNLLKIPPIWFGFQTPKFRSKLVGKLTYLNVYCVKALNKILFIHCMKFS